MRTGLRNTGTRLGLLGLFCLIVVTPGRLYAQANRVFTGETAQYPEELSAFMQKNNNEEGKLALDLFLEAWTRDSLYTPDEQQEIVKTSMLMIQKNARAYPYFAHYLIDQVSLKRSKLSPDNYINWSKGVDLLLSRKGVSLMNLEKYLVFTRDVIDSNYLYHTGSVSWRMRNADFHFQSDSAVRIVVKKANLVCYAVHDSILIEGTSGEFNPVTNVWIGKSGTVTWERAGFKPDEVFARLNTYVIHMNRSEYTARNAEFINRIYFKKSLTGDLTDKVQLIRNPETADYPRFDSYQKNFIIHNLYKDINYEGGLSMQGAEMVGAGSHENQATVNIFHKDTLVLIARSAYFAFKANRINAMKAEIVIRLREDSIYHPGLSFTYIVPSRELTLYRTEDFISQSPYFDSYHNLDMTFDQLIWKMDEPVMRFTALMGSTIGNANFESVNFFNYSQFQKMQLMDEVHPLAAIRGFARHMGTNEFLVDDFAAYLQKPIYEVRQLIMRMAAQGFLFYDAKTGMVTIRQRLHDYLAASVAKIDYDVISIPSTTTSPLENAVFDLRNYDLTINGVPRIFVSDSQNVAIYPSKARIVMKQNRHFSFNGQVQAGLFTFAGKNFAFDYDSFKIKMAKIDSVHMRYLTGAKNDYGFPITAGVSNLIQDMKGDLYIDKPDNKSGRKSYPQYPIFVSTENGYVYYNSSKIRNGVYKKDSFYYKVYPFEMDSLNKFTQKSMRFDGELTSSGIFPVIHEPLTLQKDKSLGFKHHLPEPGVSVYGGKGSFDQDISLSNKGLIGKGNLHYLTASMNSDSILFFPDSVNMVAREFTMAEKIPPTEYPDVISARNAIRWLPKKDVLFANRTDTAFVMFHNKALLSGNLKLKPSGLTGSGHMYFEGAEMKSNDYAYKSGTIHADTADFYLKSLHSKGYTVLTENMAADINVIDHTGTFNSNEDYSLVSFPENKYVSFLDHFAWDMNKKELNMSSTKTVSSQVNSGEEQISGPRYISLDPAQDSLSFISPVAVYDYDSNLIKATAVKYIDIADARIYPANECLTVNPDARLRTLYKSGLVANRNSRYYSLHDATLTIMSRNAYTGMGYFDYVDEINRKQTLYFSDLGVDNNKQTIGSGEVAEADNFTLSPNYRYKGKFYLEADKPFLTFDGGTLIEQNCEKMIPKWVYFRSEINPKDILIPIGDPLIDMERDKIFNGLYMYYDSVHVYPAFLSGRKNYSDVPLISSSGFLKFDKKSQEYLIGAQDKLSDPTLPGNILHLHRESCELGGEGRLTLGEKLGQLKLTVVGNASFNPANQQTKMNVIMGVDFFINDNLLDIMAAEIDSMPRLPAVDLNRADYTLDMVQLLGSKEKYESIRSELSLFGGLKEYPPEMKHTMMFNELNLEWNDESNSWVSVGKIGIGSIDNKPVNKRVDGLVELQIKRSGDIMDIYLQMDRRTWYYFGYTRGVMQIQSSNSAFIDKMMKMKTAERRLKVSSGESYIYMVATDTKKNTFLRRYRELQEDRQNGDNP